MSFFVVIVLSCFIIVNGATGFATILNNKLGESWYKLSFKEKLIQSYGIISLPSIMLLTIVLGVWYRIICLFDKSNIEKS